MIDENTKVIVTLLHGTFAKGADWTKKDSSLCLALIESLNNRVVIESEEWSGCNTVFARIKAAESLYIRLSKQKELKPGIKQIVIGHSHGGSAIAYAIKKHPELAKSLCGVFFLSTPFISLRLRSSWETIMRTLRFSLSVWFTAIVALVYFVIIFWLNDADLRFWGLSLGMVIFPSILIWSTVPSSKIADAENKLKILSQDVSTTNMPSGNYHFFRASGDEAAGVLALLQMLNLAVGYLNKKLAKVIELMIKPFTPRVLSIFIAAFVFFEIGLTQNYFRVHRNPSIDEWTDKYLPLLPLVIDNLTDFYLNIFMVPYYCGFVILITTLIIPLAYAVTSWIVSLSVFFGFGRLFLWDSLYFDVAVEPLPEGSYSLWHQGWDSISGDKLSHSVTYNDPKIIHEICARIEESLKSPIGD